MRLPRWLAVGATAELCADEGHPYHSDDNDGGRCWCGARRYPGWTEVTDGS